MVDEVPPMGAERVLSVIPNVGLKSGFMGLMSRSCSLVLTDQRVLIARFTLAQSKQLSKDAREHAKAEGKGRMGQLVAQTHAWDALVTAYLSMPPEQILAENPDNIAVDRTRITKVKVVHKEGSTDTAVASDTLVINTSGKKYKLTFMGSMRQAREALATAGLN